MPLFVGSVEKLEIDVFTVNTQGLVGSPCFVYDSAYFIPLKR